MTDTGTIFEHEDSDGDGFVLWEDGGGLDLQRFGSNPYCDMAPADVRRLHSALGQWLTKNGVPAEDVNLTAPKISVGGDYRLRSVIREEILEALLLLKATADYCNVPYETSELDSRAYRAIETVARASRSQLEGRTMSAIEDFIRRVVREEIEAWFTKTTDSILADAKNLRPLTPTVNNLMKMEVDDVTHGGDDCWGEACKLCGHVSGVHTGKAGCHVPDTSAPDGYCACTRITAQCALPKLPMRIRRRTCSECGEPWEPGHRTSCIGPLHASAPPASAPHSGCTCKGHLHELHLDKYACNRRGCFCPNPKDVQS